MIHEIFDFFPFNISSGPAFLGFYFILAVSALIAAARLRRAVGVHLDHALRTDPASIAPDPVANEGPYRAPSLRPVTARQRLTVGWIPGPDEHWTIAYLQGGERGVANTLIGTAMTVGWFTCLKQKPGTVQLFDVVPPEAPELSVFHARLTAYHKPELTYAEVRNAATSAAMYLEAGIERDLIATGMVRSAATVRTLSLIVWLFGALVLGVGLIRFVRAIELDRPVALLIFEMLFFVFGVVIMSLTTSSKSTRRDEYVKWLRDATVSLRADVARGRRSEAPDIGLAVAVAGASALASGDPTAMIYRVLLPAPLVSTSSSGSSSSSGGSSFGGGSSCGGGSGGGSSCGGSSGCGG